MADLFPIEFEPLGSLSPVEGELHGVAPRARALILANAPAGARMIGRTRSAHVRMQAARASAPPVPPSINTLFGSARKAAVKISDTGVARLNASATRPRAFFSDIAQQDRLVCRAPRAIAYLRDTEPEMQAFIHAHYVGALYAIMWAGTYRVTLDDALLLDDDFSIAQLIVVLRDRLNLRDSTRSIMSAALELGDTLVLSDALRAVYMIVMQDTMLLDGSLEQTRTVLQQLTDTLVVSGLVDTALDAFVALASVLSLSDAAQAAWYVVLADALGVGDASSTHLVALARVIETLVMSDGVDMTLTVYAQLADALPMADGLAAVQLDARVGLRDALEMFGHITINGDTWACWAINTESKGVSRYTNYPFNSFAQLPDGRWIAATDTGLHLLGGDTDAGEPITARIRSALTDFGSRNLKRVPNMYIGYTADGQVGLKVIATSETGAKTEDHYLLEPRPASAVRESRYKVGRGIASVFLGFELVNMGGAQFALDAVEWLPLRLDRRVR